MGAKYYTPPLSLITVAAILPQNWHFRLIDENCDTITDEDIDWADIVCAGGMLPQQTSILHLIERVQRRGRYIAVGGPDPTSQPHIYQQADALVLGEGEISIPMWLEKLREGRGRGVFSADGAKADMHQTPIPRFDLLKLKDYISIGIQYSRGCPFNCEFCDIIELYGRKPRTKTSQQMIAELQALYDLGYRGSVDIVDDNFIGNKRFVKKDLLPAMIDWGRKHRYPFFFVTEASLNLADDRRLLRQMRAAQFKTIFMGIETPDPEVLLETQKSQNTIRPLVERIERIYEYGILVTAGFILGFDGEKAGADRSMIAFIEETNICIAMVGLLVALPNTQLTRRLIREKRLMTTGGEVVTKGNLLARADRQQGAFFEGADQTSVGLNFETIRDRKEVLREYLNVIQHIYDPAVYAARTMRLTRALQVRTRYLPRPREILRLQKACVKLCWQFTKRSTSRRQFWLVWLKALCLGPFRFEVAMRMMSLFLHFEKHVQHATVMIESMIEESDHLTEVFNASKARALESERDTEAPVAVPPPPIVEQVLR